MKLYEALFYQSSVSAFSLYLDYLNWKKSTFISDRVRTTINILGDAIGAGIIDHLTKKELEALNKHDLEEETYY